jgi:hypothetical protein
MRTPVSAPENRTHGAKKIAPGRYFDFFNRIGPSRRVAISGPRGSLMIAHDFDWWLLIGDETALPSIGRRLEELGEGVRAITLVAVTGPAEEQVFDTQANHRAIWVHRHPDEATNPQSVVEALNRVELHQTKVSFGLRRRPGSHARHETTSSTSDAIRCNGSEHPAIGSKAKRTLTNGWRIR